MRLSVFMSLVLCATSSLSLALPRSGVDVDARSRDNTLSQPYKRDELEDDTMSPAFKRDEHGGDAPS